jgi:hypothetical protein
MKSSKNSLFLSKRGKTQSFRLKNPGSVQLTTRGQMRLKRCFQCRPSELIPPQRLRLTTCWGLWTLCHPPIRWRQWAKWTSRSSWSKNWIDPRLLLLSNSRSRGVNNQRRKR